MSTRLFAFAIWAAVAASLMFWGLRLLVSGPVAPSYTVSAVDPQGVRGDLARVFGSSATPESVAAAPPAAASRFKLMGVAAPRDALVAGGLALISVDGKPARAIPVGRTIDDGWVLQSVNKRGARLSSNLGASTLDLEVPLLPTASRGALPPVGNTIEGPTSGAVPPAAPAALPRVPTAGAAAVNGAQPAAGALGSRPVTASPVIPAGAMPGGAANGPPSIFVPAEELNAPTGSPTPAPRGGVMSGVTTRQP